MSMKKYILSLFAIVCFLLFPLPIHATENHLEAVASFDLSNDSRQEQTIQTKEGEVLVVLTSLNQGRKPYAIQDGTYLVEYTSFASWSASFKINISNNNITSVHSGTARAITGSITSTRLEKVNNTQAKYHITRKLMGISYYSGMQASVSGSSLNVSGI